MALEGGFPPATARDIARVRGRPAQQRQNLRAIDLDLLRIEARRGQSKPQHVEGFVAIFHKRAHRAADIVTPGAETHFDGFALQPVGKRLGIQIARAVVEQRGCEIGSAGLAGRVLDRAADECKVDGDQRHRRLLHQPCLDAA